MRQTAFWLNASDTSSLYVNHWSPTLPPKAIIILAHGMAEHSERYTKLAEWLVHAGMAVYALDLRGHGHTAQHGLQGHFADDNGWQLAIEDLRALNHLIRCESPHTPVFLFGHSLGSYLVLNYLMQYSSSVQGAILSGSHYLKNTLKYRLVLLLARFERWRLGKQGRSHFLHQFIFSAAQRAFKPQLTRFDWLSSDAVQVERYLKDPHCGFTCTTQLWIDVLNGLQRITPIQNLVQIENQLPMFIFGGEHDPIHRGHRLLDLAEALRQSGNRVIDVKLYSDMRHEPLNELNSERVYQDIVHWLEQRCLDVQRTQSLLTTPEPTTGAPHATSHPKHPL